LGFLAVTVAFGGFGLWWTLTHGVPFPTALLAGLTFSGACFGWRFLSRHAPRLLVANLFGWLFYSWVKLILSGVIGPFVLPFSLYHMGRELRVVWTARALLQ
jgi:hypothetical protein